MKKKKQVFNPFYSIQLQDLQDLIFWFQQESVERKQVLYPTKNRIDETIKVLTSKMQ